jgi:hypothetical protein
MATSFDPRNPIVQATSGKIPQILHGYLEANSQTFKAGQFVYLTSGTVTVSADGDVPVMGIALADATNVTSLNATIPVQVLGPDDEVLINVCTSAGVLEAANTTCVPGVAYDLQTVDTNLHYIDSSDTTNPKFIFLGPVLGASGSASYRGRFRPYYLENQATTIA